MTPNRVRQRMGGGSARPNCLAKPTPTCRSRPSKRRSSTMAPRSSKCRRRTVRRRRRSIMSPRCRLRLPALPPWTHRHTSNLATGRARGRSNRQLCRPDSVRTARSLAVSYQFTAASGQTTTNYLSDMTPGATYTLTGANQSTAVADSQGVLIYHHGDRLRANGQFAMTERVSQKGELTCMAKKSLGTAARWEWSSSTRRRT